MKKILFVLLAAGLVLLKAQTVSAENYVVNDQQIDQLMGNSEDVSASAIRNVASLSNQLGLNDAASKKSVMKSADDKNFAVALILNILLGDLGIHRLYLGTKTMTWVGYILTCGGIFGVVPFVDFIELIIHNADISPFVDNPHFFMWANG